MKPREFDRLYRGFLLRQELEWDRTRTIGALLVNAHSKTSTTPRKFRPLRIIDALEDIDRAKSELDREEEFRQLRDFNARLKAKEAKK